MSKNVLKLFLASVILLAACAPVRVEMPSYGGKTFGEVLSGMQDITEVRTRFSITFLRDGRQRKGDAALDVSRDGDMSLRVYSLGFLAMELSSKDGRVKSSPPMAQGNYYILAGGLRDCFYWWVAGNKGFTVREGYYVLSDAWRTVWVDRRTFLPVRQEILLDNGREVDIKYDRPRRDGDVWFQSRIRIEYNGYSADLSVSHMSFQRSGHLPS